MAFSHFSYTRSWTDSTAFPTVMSDETLIRANIQDLYDQAAEGINSIIDNIETSVSDSDSKIPTSKAVRGYLTSNNYVKGTGSTDKLAKWNSSGQLVGDRKLTVSTSNPPSTGGTPGDIWIQY